MIKVDYILPDGRIGDSIELADGYTLDIAARTLFPDLGGKFPAPVLALVGATPAVRSLGDWDVALADTSVQFREIAMGGGGGGSNPLQMVLQICIIVLAAAATWYVGGLGGTFLGMGMSFWGGLAGVGVMLLGTLLMGALFPQQMPSGQMGALDAAQASPTYSINSQGNQARLYQPEPEGFGRMKIVPDFVAQTWMEYIDNDQYGYFVYGVGRGRYEIESLQFGETVFWRDGELVKDTGYEIQEIEFVEPGEAVTIFPDNVVTSDEVSGQELFGPNDEEYDGPIGPFTTNPAGTKTNKLLYDFVLQRGIGKYSDQGKLQKYTIKWKIEYRQINDLGQATTDWVVLEEITLTDGTLTPQRLTKTYEVTEGRYETRVSRTSDTSGDGKTMDDLVWSSLRAMLPGTLSYPISCVAFSIKASNTLTQNASRQFAIIATRKLPLYDRQSGTWGKEVPTRSWAAAVSHICKSEWGGGITDTNLDLNTLWAIDERLQAKKWYYDSYIDSAYLVWGLIGEVCQSQCVIPRFIGPVLSFVEDGPDRPPTFALTPRNIVRNTFSVTYATWSDDSPDDVTVEYLDAEYGFQQRDVTATLPESESKEPATLSILGITDRSHAHKVAVAYAAHNRWQRVVVECQVEALGRIINRGDICTVAHPRFKNTAAGAVESWTEAKLEIRLATDMKRVIPEGVEQEDDLYMALTKQDGSIWGPCKLASIDKTLGIVRLSPADYSNLLLQGQDNPFGWMTSGIDRNPTTWTLYIGKTYQRLMFVDAVTTQDALHYNLRLLNYDSRIYQYGDLAVPPWQGRSQVPTTNPDLKAPSGVRILVESAEHITVTWNVVSGASWYDMRVSTNGGQTWTDTGRVNINSRSLDVVAGVVTVQVRAVNDITQGPWSAQVSADTTIPVPLAPEISQPIAYDSGAAEISWNKVNAATSYQISLSYDTNGEVIYTKKQAGTKFSVTPEIQTGGPYRTLHVSVVATNSQGGASVPATVTLSDPAPGEITSATIQLEGTTVTLSAVEPAPPDDCTGFVLAEGTTETFTQEQFTSTQLLDPDLPLTLAFKPGTHYFRLAVRDGFWDLKKNLQDMTWSGVFTLEIPEA